MDSRIASSSATVQIKQFCCIFEYTGLGVGEVEMMLYVQYQNDRYDFVNAQMLDRLLTAKKVRQFYRPSEKRWIDVSNDPVRGLGGFYLGPNRRHRLKILDQ